MIKKTGFGVLITGLSLVFLAIGYQNCESGTEIGGFSKTIDSQQSSESETDTNDGPSFENEKEDSEFNFGKAGFTDVATQVDLGLNYSNPVVIAGPPTMGGGSTGAVRVFDVTSNSFKIHYDESAYHDGPHNSETASYMVLEEGKTTRQDGSIWVVKKINWVTNTNRRAWVTVNFDELFPGKPQVFLTGQTINGPDTFVPKIRNLSRLGFEYTLFEEDAILNGHTDEVIGMLAVYGATSDSQLEFGTGPISYDVSELLVSSVALEIIPGWNLFLQEDQSEDTEADHQAETLSVMTLDGDHLFVQITTNNEDEFAQPRIFPVE